MCPKLDRFWTTWILRQFPFLFAQICQPDVEYEVLFYKYKTQEFLLSFKRSDLHNKWLTLRHFSSDPEGFFNT